MPVDQYQHDPVIEPVERKSLADGVYVQMLRRIVDREFDAGEALPGERALSHALHVNRNALREALKRLQQAGLVHVRQGGRSRVANYLQEAGLSLLADLLIRTDGHLDAKVVRSIVEMRGALGPDIARKAALRAAPLHQRRLVELQSFLSSATERSERQQASLQMWDTLADASDNVAYRLAFNTLRGLYLELFGVLTEVLAEELDDIEGHHRLVQAVEAGDADAAGHAAEALLERGAAALIEAVQKDAP